MVSAEPVALPNNGVNEAPNEDHNAAEEDVIPIESSKEQVVEEIRSSFEEPVESPRRQPVQVEQSSHNNGVANE